MGCIYQVIYLYYENPYNPRVQPLNCRPLSPCFKKLYYYYYYYWVIKACVCMGLYMINNVILHRLWRFLFTQAHTYTQAIMWEHCVSLLVLFEHDFMYPTPVLNTKNQLSSLVKSFALPSIGVRLFFSLLISHFPLDNFYLLSCLFFICTHVLPSGHYHPNTGNTLMWPPDKRPGGAMGCWLMCRKGEREAWTNVSKWITHELQHTYTPCDSQERISKIK